jgi:ATP-dependent Lon protease
VKGGLTTIPVKHWSKVLEHALVRKPEAIEWDEAAEEAAAAALKSGSEGEGARAH